MEAAQFDVPCDASLPMTGRLEPVADASVSYLYGEAPHVNVSGKDRDTLRDEVKAVAYVLRGHLRQHFALEVDEAVSRNRRCVEACHNAHRWTPPAHRGGRVLFPKLVEGDKPSPPFGGAPAAADVDMEASERHAFQRRAGVPFANGGHGVVGGGAGDGAAAAGAADERRGAEEEEEEEVFDAVDIKLSWKKSSAARRGPTTGKKQQLAQDTWTCALTTLAHGAVAPPRTTSYVTIRSNDLVEDERVLHFVPYFGDDEKEDDDGFDVSGYDAVLKEQSVRVFSPVDDTVIRSIVAHYGRRQRVLRALAEAMPGNKWNDLRKRFDEFKTQDRRTESLRTPSGTATLKATRLGGAVACGFWIPQVIVFTNRERFKSTLALRAPDMTSRTPDDHYGDLMESYRDLLCRRCFVYDCKKHGVRHPLPKVRAATLAGRLNTIKQQNRRKKASKRTAEVMDDGTASVRSSPVGSAAGDTRVPCSETCFMLHGDALGELDEVRTWMPGGGTPSFDVPSAGDREVKQWQAAERTLLPRLIEIADGDPCKAAAMLQSRTCTSVWRAGRRQILKLAWAQRNREFAGAGSSSESSDNDGAGVAARSGVNAKRFKPDPDLEMKYDFRPCSHEGPCTPESKCSCARKGLRCEKYCPCPPSCGIKFRGCRCKTAHKSRCTVGSCACVAARRECDPDLCHCCYDTHQYPPTTEGLPDDVAREVLDEPLRPPPPQGPNRGSDPHVCRNMAVTMGIHKIVRVAPSATHGWGGFLGSAEGAHKEEMVYEYTGELISQEEADRRGKVYDKLKCSFLFNLNSERVVDATRKGNKVKFVNHNKTPNCVARVLRVRAEHRIGIFAKTSIAPGDELFFDYGYDKEQQGSLFIRRGGSKEGDGDGDGAGAGAGVAAVGICPTFGRQRRTAGNSRKLLSASRKLSHFVRAFIDQTDSHFKREWSERTYLMRVFNTPPDMDAMGVGGGHGSGALMYADTEARFEQVLFRGVETDLLIFNILTFAVCDLWFGNTLVSAFLTVLVNELLNYVRLSWGVDNIAAKTLVDDRFLS
uniref:Uncharacterized protein n=1 Tax=Bicosoecida sp. CB-2014 TaxID=1486930 RepID=A0A7S1CKP3_9STRA